MPEEGEEGVREVSDKEDEERAGHSGEGRPEEGWVGALPGGGNLSNWFSLTARTQSCLSTWQTDSVRFSPMYWHIHTNAYTPNNVSTRLPAL